MPSSKSNKPPTRANHQWSFEAIGTAWWIGLFEPVTDIKRLKQRIAARISLFDQNYSRFRRDSLVAKIAAGSGVYQLPEDGQKMLAFYWQLYKATDGLVTPLIGQVLAQAGYDADYSLKPGAVSPAPKWQDVLSVEGPTLTAKAPVLLDFGAAGKGYLVDIICELLRAEGIKHFCVDAGGDMRGQGLGQDFRVGLENPDDPARAIGVVKLTGGALCASAVNKRRWAGYHHIMNPKTGQSVNAHKAVWVLADEAMLADGLATALFFVSPAKLKDFRFAYCLLTADNKVERSDNFAAEILV
jgi:thiamine biosynthesis lipoprotein